MTGPVVSDIRLGQLRSPAGFTLLEVLIAIAIIAIALVALLGSQARSIGRAGEATFYHLAPLLASAKLAEVEGGLAPAEDGAGDFAPDRSDYRWQLRVGAPVVDREELLPGLAAAIRRVEVIVTREGTSSSYSLVSYFLHHRRHEVDTRQR